jgi:tetratricopeptide (TPR) repeat protein
VSAEAEAVDDVIERCAHLPLALAVVAAQAGTEPHRSLAALAAELRDSPSALEALTAGDPATDVAGVFSWSYRRLTPAAARLFRLLGLHPGPSVNVAAAASLAGLPVPRVRALLTELTQANLLTEHRLGRFSFHDLLCGYAAGQAQRLDSEAQRRFARQRLLDHFVHTVYAINLRLYPHRNPPAPPPPESGVTLPRLDSDAEALDWLIVERGVLVAAIEQAVALGFHQHTWHLAWNLQSFFNRRAQGPEWVATARAALAAAERLDDAHLRGQAHRNLALASGRVDRLDDAYTQLRLALALAVEVGDLAGQAHTLHHLGLTRQRQRRYAEAQEYAQQAIALYRETGHRRGEAHALNGYGWYSALLGQYEMALAACEEALALLEEFDDRQGYAHTLHSIGYAHQHLGHHEKAIEFYRSSIELHRRFGDRFGEAQSLTQLGDALREPDPVAARRAWEQALAILDDLHHPDAADVQGRLSRVDYP